MMPDYRVRAAVQGRLIETWTVRLQEEVEARQALEARLVTLEEQYQELRRTVESLARRRKRSTVSARCRSEEAERLHLLGIQGRQACQVKMYAVLLTC